MILKNKKLLFITSLLILLPIPVGLLLWDRFPVELQQSKFFLIYLPPLSILAAQWLCAILTSLDPGNEGRNRKVQNLVLWIIPIVSWFCCGVMYALYLGIEVSAVSWTLVLMGVLFVAIGNYMPKTRMNRTIGIKVSWAYSSDENWAATHRFAGRLWVIGGILLLLGIFLPEGAAIALMIFTIIVLCVVPILYSYRFWKKQKAAGVPLKEAPAASPVLTKMSLILLALILVFTAAITFTGNISYSFGGESFTVEADWYSDLTVRYDDIQTIAYREGNVDGTRVGGFGSFRLLMGFFQNEEFGTYTRYTYYKPDACVVLTVNDRILVLSGKTAEETKEVYQTLLETTE